MKLKGTWCPESYLYQKFVFLGDGGFQFDKDKLNLHSDLLPFPAEQDISLKNLSLFPPQIPNFETRSNTHATFYILYPPVFGLRHK